MNRRDFFKKGTMAAGAAGLSLLLDTTGLWAQDIQAAAATAASAANPAAGAVELVAIKGGEPDVMFDKAIAVLGGMERFVKKGQIVVLKPNMSWDKGPETGANTNPALVKRVAEHCVKAGAGKVYVMDYNINEPACETSGVREAAEAGGATFVYAYAPKCMHLYKEVENPNAEVRKKIQVHETLLGCDVLINIPVLKSHGGTQLTMAMKNLMGCIADRRVYHRDKLDQSIIDFLYFRKPDLNIMDAYRVMTSGGPSASKDYTSIMPKMLFISPDIVAIDTVGQAQAIAWGVKNAADCRHVKMAAEAGLGESDLKKMKITKLDV